MLSGCSEKAFKLDKIKAEKIWLKKPIIWKSTNYLLLKRGLYPGQFWFSIN